MTRVALAILALLLPAVSVSADLVGSDLQLNLSHTGMLGSDPTFGIGPTGGAYTYGTVETFDASLLGFPYGSWIVSSPSIVDTQPGEPVVWTMTLDFGAFAYDNFAGETGTLEVAGLIEHADIGTVDVTVDDASVMFDIIDLSNGGFAIRWLADDVLNDTTGAPELVVIEWSSAVPGPGALVCLCVLGTCAIRGRRRG